MSCRSRVTETSACTCAEQWICTHTANLPVFLCQASLSGTPADGSLVGFIALAGLTMAQKPLANVTNIQIVHGCKSKEKEAVPGHMVALKWVYCHVVFLSAITHS